MARGALIAAALIGRCWAGRQFPTLPASLPAHPRLILTDGGLQSLLALLDRNSDATQLYGIIQQHGYELLNDTSSATGIWDYMYTLGVLHRIDCARQGASPPCKSTWSDRAISFLVSQATAADVCGDCSNNNCSSVSFYGSRTAGLCTATLGHSLAVGYDWLYRDMTPQQRSAVATGIATQILAVYSQGLGAAFVHEYWYESLDNFNSAINTGAVLSSLAVAYDPDLPVNVTGGPTSLAVSDTFTLAVISLARSVAGAFQGDGGHPEGPTYGAFGMQFMQAMLDGLVSATGSDYGLALPSQGGRFLLDMLGASGLYWNWADTSSCTGSTSGCDFAHYEYLYTLAWYGRANADPALAYVARAHAAGLNATWGFPGHWEPKGVKYLLDFVEAGNASDLSSLAPSRLMNDTRLAVMRNGWGNAPGTPPSPACAGCSPDSPGCTWAGIKGSDNHLQQILKATTHTHADGGGFALDMGGVRWATDLGSGSYAAQGYFSLQKWDFYNSGTAGHNTLMFNGQGQDACTTWGPTGDPADCQAVITGFSMANSTHGDAWATLDLSGVYVLSTGGAPVRRGMTLRTARGSGTPTGVDWLGVRDEFPGALVGTGANVTWAMHTFANITILSPVQASLTTATISGSLMTLSVIADKSTCPGAGFTAVPLPSYEAPGLSKLVLTGSGTSCTGFNVVMALGVLPSTAPSMLAPLSSWPTSGPWQGMDEASFLPSGHACKA